MAHCRAEGVRLKGAVASSLHRYCDGAEGRPTLRSLLSKPLVSLDRKADPSLKFTLLEAHCLAAAVAAGLDTLGEHVDPPDQRDVMLWILNRLLVEDDVGPGNAGHAPSPRPRPGMHVSYFPDTFVGGIPSQLQNLTGHYKGRADIERVAILLLGLRVVIPKGGIKRRIWENENYGSGVVGRNILGLVDIDLSEVDEWDCDLVFTDAGAVISDLPGEVIESLISDIESLDPFWPAFCARSRLVY